MDAKEQLRNMVTRLHREAGVDVEPTYPRVLVRVLPKEQMTVSGLLVLPDTNQNKTVYEAIVLKTYKSRVHKADDGSEHVVECCVQPGDHILFPHFEGYPIPRLDAGVGEYRLIPEEAFHAVLCYEQQTTQDWLRSLFRKNNIKLNGTEDAVIDTLLQNAHVTRFDQTSKTLSGR